jgi:hypothetical protein
MPRHPHELADRRSLALHEQVAERLSCDPSIVERARQVVERWDATQSIAPVYVRAWYQLLRLPIADIVTTLRECTETANALRQVSPFLHVLSPRERWEILRHERATRALP